MARCDYSSMTTLSVQSYLRMTKVKTKIRSTARLHVKVGYYNSVAGEHEPTVDGIRPVPRQHKLGQTRVIKGMPTRLLELSDSSIVI